MSDAFGDGKKYAGAHDGYYLVYRGELVQFKTKEAWLDEEKSKHPGSTVHRGTMTYIKHNGHSTCSWQVERPDLPHLNRVTRF